MAQNPFIDETINLQHWLQSSPILGEYDLKPRKSIDFKVSIVQTV